MKLWIAVLVSIAALTVAATASAARSSAGTAVVDVCTARTNIAADVADIQADIVAPGTPVDIVANLNDIGLQLRTIRAAQPALPTALGEPVRRATTAFVVLAAPVVRGLLLAPGGPAPLPRYKAFTAAQTAFGPLYAKTLGALKCP
jgi:hypothetical protein